MSKKNTITVKQFKPGLITDLNVTVNPGYTRFENLKINTVGKFEKRKGWSVLYMYEEHNRDVANLPISYDSVYTDANKDSVPRTDFIHVHSKSTVASGSTTEETEYIDLLFHRIYDNVNTLWHRRIDKTTKATIAEYNLTPALTGTDYNGDSWGLPWKNWGNVTFIDTPDHTYIINGYKAGDKAGNVFKYDYGDNARNRDPIRLQNIGLAILKGGTGDTGSYKLAEDPVEVSSLTRGKHYFYGVAPVYNTGVIGNITKSPGHIYVSPYDGGFTANPGRSVLISVKPTYDPYITHYRIFRTKQKNSDYFDFYNDPLFFVEQVEVPANTGFNEFTLIYNDILGDDELGSEYIESDSINSYVLTPTTINDLGSAQIYGDGEGYFIGLSDSTGTTRYNRLTTVSNHIGMRATCGTYAQSRSFFGGDRLNPDKLFVSEIDRSDNIRASLTYTIPLASLQNEITAIREIGNTIFVLCESSTYKLIETNNPELPYVLELVDSSKGCDSPSAFEVLNRVGFFMFKGKLQAMSEYGDIKEISGAINTKLAGLDADPATYVLRANESQEFIKIMFRRNSDQFPINIDFYPEDNLYTEEIGIKQIFTPTGETDATTGKEIVSLNEEDERFLLTAYCYNQNAGEEWGINFDGDIVYRGSDYADVSKVNSKVSWQDYIYNGDLTLLENSFNIKGVIEKPFVFESRVQASSIIFYGTGTIKFKMNYDETGYTAEKEVTLNRAGVEVPLGKQGFIIKVLITHDTNEDIDLDLFELKVTGKQGTNIKNKTSSGTTI